uniref:Uncharacterized protein n=1 Tax=Arundo donax TaxID=35708 RepID=A0A0A9BEM7_ARUDO
MCYYVPSPALITSSKAPIILLLCAKGLDFTQRAILLQGLSSAEEQPTVVACSSWIGWISSTLSGPSTEH